MTKSVSASVLRLRVAALLAGTCLGATGAQAVDGTWLAAPATNEWTTGTNWSSSPAVPDGTAIFGTSSTTSLNISGNTSIGTIQLDTGAPAYSFDIGPSGGVDVNIVGAGIVNKSTALSIANGGRLNFSNASTAGNAAIDNFADVTFNDSATAGNAFLTNRGRLFFFNSSTAGSATINNTINAGVVEFHDSSSAGNATITNRHPNPQSGGHAQLYFFDNSTAGNATITNDTSGALILFHDTSNAGTATITNSNSAQLKFAGSSKAANATINNTSGGVIEFLESSSAANATINSSFGSINFYELEQGRQRHHQQHLFTGQLLQLELGRECHHQRQWQCSVHRYEHGRHRHHQCQWPSRVPGVGHGRQCKPEVRERFRPLSQRQHGRQRDHHGQPQRRRHLLRLEHRRQRHHRQRRRHPFHQHEQRRPCHHHDQQRRHARVRTERHGWPGPPHHQQRRIRRHLGPHHRRVDGGLDRGGGAYFLGSKQLTVGGNNLSTEVAGVIQDGGVNGGTGGSLVKTGSGTLTLSGINTYTGATTVDAGTLIVNGSIANSVLTTVSSGGTLAGTGTVGSVLVASDGIFAPGPSATPGTMTVAGNLAFEPGGIYRVQVDSAGASRANVSGTATLTGGNVQAVFAPGSSLTRQQTILHAGDLGGTEFSGVTTNLPGFAASLSYTPTDVLLNLTAGLGLGDRLSQNQQNVADSLNSYFNNGGALPPNFVAIFGLTGGNLGNTLTQLSGEPATGAQQGAFQLTGQFLGAMLDPFVDGRSRGANGPALGFAPDREKLPDDPR